MVSEDVSLSLYLADPGVGFLGSQIYLCWTDGAWGSGSWTMSGLVKFRPGIIFHWLTAQFFLTYSKHNHGKSIKLTFCHFADGVAYTRAIAHSRWGILP